MLLNVIYFLKACAQRCRNGGPSYRGTLPALRQQMTAPAAPQFHAKVTLPQQTPALPAPD
jgi:hypothetical protein